MIVLLPALANLNQGRLFGIGFAFGKALLILIPVTFIAAKLVPPLMARVPRTDPELRVLVALALGFATAAATQALGLSLALGAFLAGMIISETEGAHETLADLLPLRNVFTALFFVTIGSLIDPKALFSNLWLLGGLVVLIIVGKFVVWTAVARLFRYRFWTAVLVGLGLTQIGEFSYVLVRVARDAHLVDDNVYSATLAASLLTILLNAFLMRITPEWIGEHRLAVNSTAAR
jgi:CPA2 family monovalent cation:H+ antiporter-2